MSSISVSELADDKGLVEGDPVLDSVSEGLVGKAGVVREVFNEFLIRPASDFH